MKKATERLGTPPIRLVLIIGLVLPVAMPLPHLVPNRALAPALLPRPAPAPATLHVAESAVTQAALRAPRAALDVETVLASARVAANRDAWSALPDGLSFSGSTDAGGVDADFELFFAADGRYRFAMDGRLALSLTFDGQDLAQRTRSGPVQLLELGDRETWHLAQWIHSGYWLEPGCPLVIEWEAETDHGVTLRLSFPNSAAVSLLELDRETWLPRELRSPSLGSEIITEFKLYKPLAGVPIARAVHSHAHGVDTALYVLEAEVAAADPGPRYVMDRAPASDVQFDPGVSPIVEVKKVISGHLLVHPLVDGRDVGWFILDSGAGQICIDPGVADELELEGFGSLPAVGVAGAVEASFRQGSSLQLGPMRLDDPIYVELDLSFLAPIFGVEVAGICGYEIFARAVLDLDLEAVTLSVHDPSDFELDAGEWTRLFLDGGTPCIECRFEGERRGLFRLDLGDAGTVSFYAPAVESLRLLDGRDVSPSQVGGVGGAGKASSGNIEWFEVGGNRVEQLPVTFSQTDEGVFSGAHALGNLGSSMLKPFRLVFDYCNSRIALVPRE